MSQDSALQFFLGANTSNGFVSYFPNCYSKDYKVFVLKGTPGSGKSTLLKKLCADGPKPCELIFCSSDPDSLDGVIFPVQRVVILDGTAPHVVEPAYIGAVERLVNLGEALDFDGLAEDKEAVIRLTEQNTALHKRAARYLNAAGTLLRDNCLLEADTLDAQKILRCAGRIAHRELPKTDKNTPQNGQESIRFLSAITPKGPVFFGETLTALADKIYSLRDETGAAAKLFMSAMRKLCLKNGLSIIVCPCPLSPADKIDHIIVPDLRLAFTTANKYHRLPADDSPQTVHRSIHARRFADPALSFLCKEKIAFNQKASAEILKEAVSIMRQAKEVHNALEACYGRHIHFDTVNALTEELMKTLRLTEENSVK